MDLLLPAWVLLSKCQKIVPSTRYSKYCHTQRPPRTFQPQLQYNCVKGWLVARGERFAWILQISSLNRSLKRQNDLQRCSWLPLIAVSAAQAETPAFAGTNEASLPQLHFTFSPVHSFRANFRHEKCGCAGKGGEGDSDSSVVFFFFSFFFRKKNIVRYLQPWPLMMKIYCC